MKKKETVLDGWQEFVKSAVPRNMPVVYMTSLQVSFYAGVFWFLTGLVASLSPDSEPTEDDVKYLDGIEKELKEFLTTFNQTSGN